MTTHDVLIEMREVGDYGGAPKRLNHLRDLLLAEPNTVLESYAEGNTWLHMASASFLFGAVQVLLDLRANPNARNDAGLVPLGAIFGEHDENTAAVRTADLLIEAGTDASAVSRSGESLLYLAHSRVFPQIFARLLKAGANWDLKTATLLGRADLVAELLADARHPSEIVKSTPRLGEDAVLSSQYHDSNIGRPADTLRLLLSHGLDPNGVGGSGFHLVICALTGAQNSDMIQALIDFGCDINIVHIASGLKQTPLDIARTYGHEDSAAVLRSAGAKTFAQLRRAK